MITAYVSRQIEQAITVEATSDLSGVVYFHWYVDGAYVRSGRSAVFAVQVAPDEQVEVTAVDTNDPDFDPIVNAPPGYPSRRTLRWIRSLAADVVGYRVDQRKDGGAWSEIGRVTQTPAAWVLSFLTPVLEDLATYEWAVYPLNEAGNVGTELAFDAELIVRRPDAPEFSIAFDEGTTRVTFAAA